jgi:hypothetical protein
VVVLLLFILSSGGCTMWLAKPPIDSEWRVPMPSDVVAAILSGALVIELHAEPIAIACGAPVQPTGDGAYRIELTGNAHGQWLPIASHRMIVRGHLHRAQIELIDLGDANLPGFVWQRHHTVRIDVQPMQPTKNSQPGSLVRLLAKKSDHQRLTPLIERTLSLAASVDGSGPGLA